MKNKFTIPAILVFICATLAINSCSNWQNEPPSASIRLPLDNSVYTVGDRIDFVIGAKDLDGTITQVEIFLNGTSIAILISKPYFFGYEIKNIQPGDYNLELVATDDKGSETSKEIDIKVNPVLEEFTDPRDSNTYRYITVGNQTWMVDNLAFLPEVSPSLEGSMEIPYYYTYNHEGNDVSTAKQTEEYSKFGVLYNWEAAKQASPIGWHLPNANEWQELMDYVKIELRGYSGENALPLIHANEGGTNQYGFSAVLAGQRLSDNYDYRDNRYFSEDNSYFSEDNTTSWWTSSEEFPTSISVRRNQNNGIFYLFQDYEHLDAGLSIRCIKD